MKTEFTSDEAVFISDTHFGHANIINYCDRPFIFPHTDEMDKLMLDNMKIADEAGKTIFHMGDFVFNPSYLLKTTWRPVGQHYIVLGNHDKHADNGGKYRKLYREFFHNIIGFCRTWKKNTLRITVDGKVCVLSHEPQFDINDDELNIYGHHHNNMLRYPEKFKEDFRGSNYRWLFGKSNYYNVGVELTNYKPVTFSELSTLPRV